MNKFNLVTDYKPQGDQPQAINRLVQALQADEQELTLLGVTGSGKTFTLANVIAQLNRPTLVISHNKTLAAQLYSEFKAFFPFNAVEYFISYYDYYQPEAYVPQKDLYIEKDLSINEEIDRLRLLATSSLMSREDVIIVASVSCIYGLGSPQDYQEMVCFLETGVDFSPEEVMKKLVSIQYERNELDFSRGKFRLRGDVLELHPAYSQSAVRIQFFGDQIEALWEIEPLSGKKISSQEKLTIYPAKHFILPQYRINQAIDNIKDELLGRVAYFEKNNRHVEAYRLKTRTEYDMEMMQEIGYCSGIENYSRHLSGRKSGERPFCLIDYFPKDFLTIIDESHVSYPSDQRDVQRRPLPPKIISLNTAGACLPLLTIAPSTIPSLTS